RKDYCDLCFPDPSVSKRHVRLVRRGGKVELFDAGSRNGTMLNGKGVKHADLVPGDVIQIGKISLELEIHAGKKRRRHQVKVDGSELSEEPSEEEIDRVQHRGGGRSDSFRDFEDFDASGSKKEERPQHRGSRATVAELIDEASDPPPQNGARASRTTR